jgi:hypothetical protein
MADFVIGRVNNFTVMLDYPVLSLDSPKFYDGDWQMLYASY